MFVGVNKKKIHIEHNITVKVNIKLLYIFSIQIEIRFIKIDN